MKTAQRLLLDLARRLETEHPGAAESVREGLDETLTVLTLNLSARLRRSSATTNAAERLLGRTPRETQRQALAQRTDDAGLGGGRCLGGREELSTREGIRDMLTLVAALRARDRQLGLVTASEERQIA